MSRSVDRVEPSDFVHSRIRVHAVEVFVEDVSGYDAELCACCGDAVDGYPDEDGRGALGWTSEVSIVRVTVSDTADPARHRQLVGCCAQCAAEFVAVLGPRVVMTRSLAWFERCRVTKPDLATGAKIIDLFEALKQSLSEVAPRSAGGAA